MINDQLEAIIFDLGRVVIHLNESKTSEEFLKLSSIDEIALNLAYESEVYFNQFERGEIGASQFRKSVSDTLGYSGEPTEIDKAWNAMLGGIDKELIESIKLLRGLKKVFVLSNTNIIHETAFNKILYNSTGHIDLHEVFDKVYFSHEIGARKPELKSWQIILNEQGVSPENTLFLDDRRDNIEAAQSLNLQVLQITDPDHTQEVIKSFLS